jgi:hypothetical protein
LQRDDRSSLRCPVRSADEVHLPTDHADMPASRRFGVYLAGQVDFKRTVDGDEAAEFAENQRVVCIRGCADLDCGIAIGKPVEPARSHQHRPDRNARIDFLVPVIDDADLHQIGDPISDSSGMDTETSFTRERAGHRLGNRAKAHFNRCSVGD